MGRFWTQLLVGLAVCLAATSVRGETVTVFAAASLKNAFDAIETAFEAETGKDLVISYAGTSVLARQIEFGAPADVFASANDAWTDYLADRNLIDPASTTNFAGNSLALIAPSSLALDAPLDLASIDDLLALLGQDQRLAVALVEAVPAGIYAREALTSLGVWEALEGRLAQTDNVRAALLLVMRGETPLGIVYASDAAVSERVRVVAEVPQSTHSPIRYTASRVTASGSPSAVMFLDYLEADAARSVLAENGFLEPR